MTAATNMTPDLSPELKEKQEKYNYLSEKLDNLLKTNALVVETFVFEVANADLYATQEDQLFDTIRIAKKSRDKKRIRNLCTEFKNDRIRQAVQGTDAITALQNSLTQAPTEALTLGQVNSHLDNRGLCTSLPAILGRYAFLINVDMFYDALQDTYIRPKSFDRAYQHLMQQCRASDWLMSQKNAAKLAGTIYLPGDPNLQVKYKGKALLNTWRKPLSYLPKTASDKETSPWLDHMKWLLPDDKERNHIFDWMAHKLQYRDVKINHALLFAGAPRIGKDAALQPLRFGIGSDNISEPTHSEVNEKYQDWLKDVELVIIHEVKKNKDWASFENDMKTVLAAPPETLRLRLFNQPRYEQPNRTHGIFMSNFHDGLYISRQDGRYHCTWCEPLHPHPEKDYYQVLYDWLKADGNAITIRWLMDRDISHFDPKEPAPLTEFKLSMQEYSQSNIQLVLQTLVREYQGPFKSDMVTVNDVMQFIRDNDLMMHTNEKRIGIAFKEMGVPFRMCRESENEEGKRPTFFLWCIRNHSAREDQSGHLWHRKGNQDWIKEYMRLKPEPA